jgi:iron complex outermembrane recepter protein
MTHIMQRKIQGNSSTLVPFSIKIIASQIASILVATAALGVVTSTTVYAQETQQSTAATATKTTDENTEETEIIEVSGIRFSQRSALDRKKQAGTMQDSLVAEDIGQFPDKNIAEALQRISGVQLDRDIGEGSSVSIRGVEPDLLRVEVNNVSALGMGGGRGVDFRDMASELVKSLDVIKGSEARLTEGGIGGTIQVNTRKPNEFKEDFLSMSAESAYNDLTGDNSPKINITGVHKFDEDFGVLLNVTASDKSNVIHALRNTEWARFADYDNSPEKTVVDPNFSSVTSKADCATSANKTNCEAQWLDFNPYLPRYGIWGRDEKRVTANAMVQYRFTDNLSAHAGYTYNKRDKTATDINLQFETQSTARINPDSVIVNPETHNVSYFETANASVTNRVLNFAWDQETTQLESGFEYQNDGFKLVGLAARSTADQDIDSRDTHIVAVGIAGMKIALNEEGAPDIDLSSAYIRNPDDLSDTSNHFDLNDAASYNNRSRYKYSPHTDKATEDMLKLDGSYIPDSDFFTILRAGVQYRNESLENADYQYNIIRDVGSTYNGELWTIEDQIALISGTRKETPVFFDGYNVGVNTISTFQAVDTQSFIDAIEAVSNDNTTREDLDVRAGNYDIEVKTKAIYLQANFETSLGEFPLTGNFGVRYVQTNTAANGDVTERIIVDQVDDEGNVIIDPVSGLPLGGVEDVDHPEAFNGRKTVKGDYADTLPSINLSLGLIPDELVLYFGAAKVMSRPKVSDLNVNANCTVYKNTLAQIDNVPNYCTAGNPDLNPYRANQVDLALNWYPNDNSIVSGAFFYKDITSWVIDADTRQNIDFFGDGRLWDVKQKINGTGVSTKGFEFQASTFFSMLPEPFNNLGGSVNYTRMSAKDVGLFNQLTGEELPFPTQSKNSYNIAAFYEADSWSIRVAYNYRSEYLKYANDRSGNPAFVDDAGYLDAKFSYNVMENMKLYVEGRNLTQEVYSLNAGPGRLSDLQYAGREYTAGVSYKF